MAVVVVASLVLVVVQSWRPSPNGMNCTMIVVHHAFSPMHYS